MLATIVIPAYRARQTIGRAVAASLHQTVTDLEVIVVDDASPDDTAAVARAAAAGDPRVQVLQLAVNAGVSAARNAGIAAARGQWIAMLDADDYFATERLETLIAAATDTGADIVADNLNVTWVNGRYPDHLAFPRRRMARRTPVSAAELAAADRPRWGLRAAGYMKPVFRRAFLATHALCYREELRAFEDFHFCMQAVLAGAVLRFTPYAGYAYHVAAGSLSSRDPAVMRQMQLRSNRLLLAQAIEQNDVRAAAELERRERDIILWNQCVDIRAALARRQFAAAARTFWHMPCKQYALARFGEKAGKEVAARLGRWAY